MYNGNANGSHSYMSNGVRDMGAMGASNGYNNGNAQYPYGNTYMHRGNGAGTHGIGNNTHLHLHSQYTHPHTDQPNSSKLFH